jgi:hypothetical protein
MPVLRNLNNLDQKINKRIVNAMRKQAGDYLPDIPSGPQPAEVTTNFNNLMKSIQYITLLIEEINIDAEQQVSNWEEHLGELEEESYASTASSPFFNPRARASLGSTISSEPTHHQQIVRTLNNIKYGGISKEAINVKFFAKALEGYLGYLSKIQTASLKKTITKSVHAIAISRRLFENTDIAKQIEPIEKILLEVYKSIFNQIKGTEGSAEDFLPRMQSELGLSEVNTEDGAGRICGSTLSVYGAGRKHRLLSPAMYRAHQGEAFVYPNVNQIFTLNQARRNI